MSSEPLSELFNLNSNDALVLSVSGFNADVAIVSVEEHEETGSDHHEMALEIIGVSAGSTEFKLE